MLPLIPLFPNVVSLIYLVPVLSLFPGLVSFICRAVSVESPRDYQQTRNNDYRTFPQPLSNSGDSSKAS